MMIIKRDGSLFGVFNKRKIKAMTLVQGRRMK
jgi:hypothetical protein